MDEIYDVIVVGAGLSGLYAGKILHEAGLKVQILEYRDRVSGRQYTHRDPKFQYVDTGGAYVGSVQTKILQVLAELGLETFDVRQDLDSLLFYRGKKHTYTGGIPMFTNPFILIDINNMSKVIDGYSKELTLGKPMHHPMAAIWDSMSCADFVTQSCWTEGARLLLDKVCELPFTAAARDISFLDFLHNVRGCGGVERLTRIEGGLQGMKIKGGSSQISDRLAAKLEGCIRLNTCVKSVENTDSGVCVTACDTQSKATLKYKAKKLIFAVPISQLPTISVEPPLPEYLRILSEVTPMGASFKVNLFYKTQFWREQGLSGEMVSLDEGLVSYCLDDTKHDGSCPAIIGFISADTARKAQQLSQEERKKQIAQQYCDQFGLDEFLSPVAYFEKNWNDEDSMSTGRGCCIWTLPPGVHSTVRKLPGEPFGDIHFAGTETSSTMPGYMDGALRAGERAAVQIMDVFGIQTDYKDETTVEIPYLEPSLLEKYLPGVPGCTALLIGVAVVVIAIVIGKYLDFNS